MAKLRTLDSFGLENKKVLLRLDLNIPFINGKIADQTRVLRSIPTINYLQERNAKIIIISHLGRPKGRFNPEYSLAPLVDVLSKLTSSEVKFCLNLFTESGVRQIENLKNKEIILAENLRFHPGEENCDENFAGSLAKLADFYVNDSFACSHRSHASITSIASLLPSAAGLLLQEEIAALEKYYTNAKKPLCAIVGGSKVSTKIELLKNLLKKIDHLVIGGAMANSFFKAMGLNIGESAFEADYISQAQAILQLAKSSNCKIILPSDVAVRKHKDSDETLIVSTDSVKNENIICDIGPKTCQEIFSVLKNSSTVLWNGPLGLYEENKFSIGTAEVARIIAYLTQQNKITSIIGGGDVVAAANSFGLANSFTYCSTGGGAFLEWLEGKILPGISAISS